MTEPLASSPVPSLSSSIEDATVHAQDGTPLAARFHAPAQPACGAALIVPAMGVPQSFYAAFATWLAEEGVLAATFDYRGMGRSRQGPLRDVQADILTWAEQDTAAVLAALRERAPGLPITWIGHSLGGQIIPFVRDREGVEKILTVAAGSGWWRENAPPTRRMVWLVWWVLVPLLTPVFGYFPGKKLGVVGDLPRGVIQQWRRWCLQRAYAAGDGEDIRALYAGVTTPITGLSFTDDEMMSAASISSLHELYVGAPRAMHRISPADDGVRRIGHLGFFRAEMRALWERRVRGELATR